MIFLPKNLSGSELLLIVQDICNELLFKSYVNGVV
jgi:hypothetical protein